ncbi:MAG: solute carrier organic anion transporter, partial [bacterium]|nr:solute carrier organic anion transporter [bacterium]
MDLKIKLAFLVAVVLAIILVPLYLFFLKPHFIKRRREKIKEPPFPGEWEEILTRDFPQYLKLVP